MPLTKSISDVVQGNPITTNYQPVKAEVSLLLTELSDGQGGVGYRTGTGGTVVQGANKSTDVTLNFNAGKITTASNALGANTTVRFTVNNSLVQSLDTPLVTVQSPASKYRVWVDSCPTNSFVIALENITGGSLSEAVVISFGILKGAAT